MIVQASQHCLWRKRRRCSPARANSLFLHPFSFQPTVWRTQVELEILKEITFDVRLGFTALPLAQAAALQASKSEQPLPAPLQLPAHSVAHTIRARDTETDLLCCSCTLHSAAVGASGGVAAQQEQTACTCACSTFSPHCGAHISSFRY